MRLLGPRLSRVPSWCSLSLRFSSLVPERTTTARSVCQGTYCPAGWSCIPRKADQGVEIGVNADTCPANAPFASCLLRIAHRLIVDVLQELGRQPLVHFRFSSLGLFVGLSACLRRPGAKLRHFGVDPLTAVVAGYRETVVAIQDEVEAPYLVEAHRR